MSWSAFTTRVRLMELPPGGGGCSPATLSPEWGRAAAEKSFRGSFARRSGTASQQLVFINTLATGDPAGPRARPIIRPCLSIRYPLRRTRDSPVRRWALAPGLVFFSLNSIYLAGVLRRHGDTRTPMRISVFSLGQP